MGKVSLVCELV